MREILIDTIKRALGSTKFLAMVVGIIMSLTARIGLELPEAAVTDIVNVVIGFIASQGLADFGKWRERMRLDAEAAKKSA